MEESVLDTGTQNSEGDFDYFATQTEDHTTQLYELIESLKSSLVKVLTSK